MMFLRLLAGLACLGALPAGHASEEPATLGYRAGVLSSLVVRGLRMSEPGRPVAMASADAYFFSGVSVGATLMALHDPVGEPATGLSLRAAQDWTLDGTWTLSLAARHDRYFDSHWLRGWCYNQLGLSAAYADQWSLSWNWRPRHGPGCDNSELTPDKALEIAARWPLWGQGGVDAGLGRLSGGAGRYSYGQAGLYQAWGRATFYLGRTQTWGAAVEPAGGTDIGGGRWVGSLVWRF